MHIHTKFAYTYYIYIYILHIHIHTHIHRIYIYIHMYTDTVNVWTTLSHLQPAASQRCPGGGRPRPIHGVPSGRSPGSAGAPQGATLHGNRWGDPEKTGWTGGFKGEYTQMLHGWNMQIYIRAIFGGKGRHIFHTWSILLAHPEVSCSKTRSLTLADRGWKIGEITKQWCFTNLSAIKNWVNQYN